MSNDKQVLLKVEHLQQFFTSGKRVNRAVNDINFEVYKGEVFGLVGESGCGKTTTGRSIIRLYDITGGSVYFDGKSSWFRKDYLIKRAYVEFINPTGEAQIGINPRFNEQDEDEFRLQDVFHSIRPHHLEMHL